MKVYLSTVIKSTPLNDPNRDIQSTAKTDKTIKQLTV